MCNYSSKASANRSEHNKSYKHVALSLCLKDDVPIEKREVNYSARATLPPDSDFFAIVPNLENIDILKKNTEENRIRWLKSQNMAFLIDIPKMTDCNDREKALANQWFKKLNQKKKEIVLDFFHQLGRKDYRTQILFPG